MRSNDKLWLAKQESNGWVMPRAAWWKRLPVIRGLRGAAAKARVDRHAQQSLRVGLGYGRTSQFDLWVCYGISTGRERALQ